MMSDNMEIRFGETVRLNLGNTIPVPVRDYLLMVNKPQINGHELTGNFIIRVGDLENDAGYLQTEVDPTVPLWAKQPQKPSYTAEEIHALPDTTFIPVKVSDLENDRGYYIKPVDGIPLADLQSGLIPTKLSQLENDPNFYVKPVGGIPASDIEAALVRLINGKLDASQKGAPNGVAELDQNGMIRSYQLPSYVDDVKSYTSMSYFPAVGEDDKIYIDKSTNLQYRWGGVDVGYITIGTSLALGETANTAYRGDRGKAAYDHAMAKGQAFVSGLYKVTVNAEGHIIEAVPVAKDDITALGIPGSMPDVSGFYTKPITGIPASDLADSVIPEVPVTDVQINGTSILNNGVANIPAATASDLGTVKVDSTLGISIQSNKKLVISKASDEYIKSGASLYKPIVPANQHTSAFYALAKLVGADMKDSNNPVGTYTDAAIQGIQKLFGLAGILGPYEDDLTADRAYAIGETFVMNGKRYRATAAIAQDGLISPGTNCELAPIDGRYVRFTDKAGSTPGVVRIDPNYGVGHRDAPNEDVLMVQQASANEMKSGYGQRKPIVPSGQHTAVYYALAKLAGADMASASGETVGVYPQAQKTAIQTMLGIEADIPLIEEVSGASPSITGMPNVRYICGTVSTLTITPPASGSIVVRFTSGSTATLLTVPNTVKFPAWFDPTSLEADTVYEIIITDGVYGGVMSWAA